MLIAISVFHLYHAWNIKHNSPITNIKNEAN